MKKIKCFIIGLGNISVGYDKDIKKKDVFYTNAKSIEANKSLELIGGTDSSKKKRERFLNLSHLSTQNINVTSLSLSLSLSL